MAEGLGLSVIPVFFPLFLGGGWWVDLSLMVQVRNNNAHGSKSNLENNALFAFNFSFLNWQFERSTPKVSVNGGSNISRRDALSCVTSTLLLTPFIQTEPADARIAKPEIRRKIMEKLEQLREKAGLKRKEKAAPGEEKKLPKLENKDGSKLPKEEKKLPNLGNKDGSKFPKEEKLPKLENKDGSKLPEEKKVPIPESKEQLKLVETSF
jgi:hypothetical protein